MLIAASVPDETSRTISIDGTASTISAARSTSPSVGAPNVVPRASASETAASVVGSACPKSSGPQESTQSTYRLPLTSSMNGPTPLRMNSGSSRPTLRIARTGELTPPGIRRWARS